MSTQPSSILPNFILGFVSTASHEQKQCLYDLLQQEFNPDQPAHTVQSTPLVEDSSHETIIHETTIQSVEPSPTTDIIPGAVPIISDFVEHHNDLNLEGELTDDILNELDKLKLRSRGYNGKPAKVKTQWLCNNDIAYTYLW